MILGGGGGEKGAFERKPLHYNNSFLIFLTFFFLRDEQMFGREKVFKS